MATGNTIQTALLAAQNKELLNNLSIEYVNNAITYNYNRMFPTINVVKESGEFYVHDDVRLNTPANDLITEESAPNRVGSKFNKATYSTQEYALRYFISDKMMETTGSAINLTDTAGAVLTGALMAGAEKRFLEKFFTSTAGWTNKFTGVDTGQDYTAGTLLQWTDGASTPIEDIAWMQEQYLLRTGGFKANAIAMSQDVFTALIMHPDIAPRLTPTGSDPRTKDVLKNMLAILLDVEHIFIMNAVHNTAADGIIDSDGHQLESFSYMVKGTFFLYNHTMTTGLRTDAPALTFNYIGGKEGFNGGYPVFSSYEHWDKGIRGVFIEGRIRYGQDFANKRNAILLTDITK